MCPCVIRNLAENYKAYRTYRSKQYRRKIETDEDVGITHTSYALYYLATWATKERVPYINKAMRERLCSLFLQKAKDLEITIYGIGINPDHAHIVFSTKPVHYLPEIIKEFKGSSSRLINKEGKEFVKWQIRYQEDQ